MGIDNRIVGAAITELRMRAGMTQQQLAAGLNVSHQAVSKWERAEASPDTDNLLALAKLYGCSLDALVQQDPLPEGSFYDPPKDAEERPRFRQDFPYLLLVTVIYLVLGFAFHLWHPGWIIFLTIPLFYLPNDERC